MAVMSNLVFEMTPGQVLNSAEFASQFPITTDQSVLPAGAEGQQSGAEFNDPSVDPLPPNVPLALLPPEELPPIAFSEEIPARLPPDQRPPLEPQAPLPGVTIVAGIGPPLAVDESFIPGIGSQVAVASSPTSNVATQDFAASFTVDAPAGVQSITYALTLSSNGADSGLIDSATGNHVFLFLQGGQVVGREGVTSAQAAAGPIDFTLTADATGHVTMTELRGVVQGAGESPDSSEGTHLAAGLVSLTATVTDNNSSTASASIDLGPNITVHDDGPIIAAIGTGPAMSVDESFLPIGSTPDPTLTVSTGDFSGAFASVQGADGATTAYRLGCFLRARILASLIR